MLMKMKNELIIISKHAWKKRMYPITRKHEWFMCCAVLQRFPAKLLQDKLVQVAINRNADEVDTKLPNITKQECTQVSSSIEMFP